MSTDPAEATVIAESNRLSWPTQPNLSSRYEQDPGNGRGRSVRVLVIDDDTSMQHTLANYLVERNPNGVPVALTKDEYALLTAFLDAPQRPLTREHLLQATRIHEDIFDRSIDVQILRLRRKLETDPSMPRIIQTERGVGYTFALPVELL